MLYNIYTLQLACESINCYSIQKRYIEELLGQFRENANTAWVLNIDIDSIGSIIMLNEQVYILGLNL